MNEQDLVNHPPHYNATAIEPIDVIEEWGLGFCLGNVVKYIARAEHKGTPLDDLRKAAWYLAREIKKRETLAGNERQQERRGTPVRNSELARAGDSPHGVIRAGQAEGDRVV